MTISFWLYFTIVEMVIPIAMICIGFRMSRKPPEDMKSAIAYRTKRAKLNRETWDFANNHCGKIWYMLGIALMVLTLAVMKECKGETDETLATIAFTVVLIQIISVVISMLPTEMALKRNFDSKGNRIR